MDTNNENRMNQETTAQTKVPSEMPQVDTMKSLSTLTGFSRITISKVLNGRKGVKETTRKIILNAVEEHDFHPNIAARNLVMQKSDRIGIVLTGQEGWTFSTVNSWYFQEYLRGILFQAEQIGINVMMYTNRSHNDFSKLVRSREVDAVILVGSTTTAEQIKPLAKRKVPYVVIGYTPEEYNTNGVDYDNYGGARAAVNYLLEFGHRNIACIKTYEDSEGEFTKQRFNGVVDTLALNGLAAWTGNQRPFDFSELKDILAGAHRPTAVICIDYAVKVLSAIRDYGLSVPADVTLVGFDDHPATAVSTPPMSVVKQPLFEIGVLAVKKVFELLSQQQYTFANELLPMELVVRQSSASPVIPARET